MTEKIYACLSVDDLRWIANTVHQGYHDPPEGKGGAWTGCEKSICQFIRETIATAVEEDEHERSKER